MYRQEFNGIDAEFLEIRHFFDETQIRSGMRNAGRRMCRKTFRMDLVDVELFERDVEWSIALPIKLVVDHDALGYNVCIVPPVEGFIHFERTAIVRQKKVIRILEFSRHCFGVRIDQKLVLIEPHTVHRVEWAANLVAVQLARLQSFDEDMPHELRPRLYLDNIARFAVFLIKQQ